MKRVLILGGAVGDAPLIRAAKRTGLHVTSLGSNPEDIAHRHAHDFVQEDYSDIDAVERAARQGRFAFVIGGCNDFAAITAAEVSERLGLPNVDSSETSRLVHRKDAFRAGCQAAGLPTPRIAICNGYEHAAATAASFPLPYLVKPVDLTGGKGISRVDRREDAPDAVRRALAQSRQPRVVLEEYLIGSRHAVSCMLVDHRPVFHFIDDEHYFINQFLVSGASTTDSVGPVHAEALLHQIETYARYMSLKDGLFHVQFILTAMGPVLLDPCRRPPGDLYLLLVRFATGVDYPLAILNATLKLPFRHLLARRRQCHLTRHCVMASNGGQIEGISISPTVRRYVKGGVRTRADGDRIDNYLVDKAAILFIKYPSPAVRDQLKPVLVDHIKVRLTE